MPEPRRPARRARLSLDRREALALGVGAFVLAALPRAAHAGRRLLRRRIPVMGTLAEAAVVVRDRSHGHAALDAAFDVLRQTDRLMSRFRPDSDVGRANAAPRGTPVRVDAQTAHVLARALEIARDSGGRFDPCLGRAVALWDVTHRHVPPPRTAWHAFAGRHLWQALRLDVDPRGGVVRLDDDEAALDLGGIAKGYGVDRAAAALRAHGIEDGLVNVGGDLVTLGHRPDGEAWVVGVRDPQDPARIARCLRVSDRAVATSGDYRRYFDWHGQRYHHLLDPATGAPARSGRHSATVEAVTCLEADARATAALVHPV
jgi:thiamine biosynthesis lipoprotein